MEPSYPHTETGAGEEGDEQEFKFTRSATMAGEAQLISMDIRGERGELIWKRHFPGSKGHRRHSWWDRKVPEEWF